MSRSLKKGPFINVKLENKVLAMNEANKKEVVKTWSRASMISPDFVGHTIAVHNGNKFIPVYFHTTNHVSNKAHFSRGGRNVVQLSEVLALASFLHSFSTIMFSSTHCLKLF